MKNWFDYILYRVRTQPETPAIVMEDRVVTYGMLNVGIERCARRLIASSVGAGEHPVAVLLANPIRHLTLCLALFRIGALSVSLEHGQSGIDVVKFAAVLGDRDAGKLVAPGSRIVEVTDDWFGADIAAGGALPETFSDPAQICRLSLTSGATGTPKIVTHRVEDVGRRALGFFDFNWAFALCMPGLSSNWGFTTSCAVLAAGRTLCFSASPFQAARMIDLFSIDYIMASTEQLLALTRAARRSGAHLASLRTIEFGGSVATRTLLEAAVTHLCKDVYCRYGASEIGLIARAPVREVLANPGLVGQVVPDVEIGIFDGRGGRCKVDEVGIVKGRLREEPGASASGRGPDRSWADLGDLGWVDAGDRLFIAGRTADAPAAGAQRALAGRISLVHEVEHLVRLEWDLVDAAAILAEDTSPSMPEIWVGIVGNKDVRAEALRELLRLRGIENPLRVMSVPAIPRGANGKVNRADLNSLMRASAGRHRET